MLKYEDMVEAHKSLDDALNITDVAFVEGDVEAQMAKFLADNYGVDSASVRQLGNEYAGGMLTSIPALLAATGDPMTAVASALTSAFYQGFLVALATAYAAGGNTD